MFKSFKLENRFFESLYFVASCLPNHRATRYFLIVALKCKSEEEKIISLSMIVRYVSTATILIKFHR